jgi:hypothetical protein
VPSPPLAEKVANPRLFEKRGETERTDAVAVLHGATCITACITEWSGGSGRSIGSFGVLNMGLRAGRFAIEAPISQNCVLQGSPQLRISALRVPLTLNDGQYG